MPYHFILPNDLYRFIAESNRIENIDRPPYDYEIDALDNFLQIPMSGLGIRSLEQFLESSQIESKLRNEVGLDVVVGMAHRPPRGGVWIVPMVERIFNQIRAGVVDKHQPAYYIHREYEYIHPFTDGNGRSGRALWLWIKVHIEKDISVRSMSFLQRWYYDSLPTHETGL